MSTPVVQTKKSVDGNTAAAHIAYALSDISFLFPITPATSMGELADLWAETGRKNIWGMKVDVCPMQSEGGVSGAIHGAAAAGAIVSTFTCSQGLMLMIPNMFRLAGEVQPCVIHVSSRAVGGQSLTIYADHNDVMTTRATGWAYIHSTSVQEVADMALVAHLATLESSVPFLHWFDGFRTSHEISKIELPEYSAISKLVDRDAVQRLRDRSLNPLHPHLLGTVEGADVFFQIEERTNPFFNSTPAIVERIMKRIEAVFGRRYNLFDYYGAPDAECVVVLMGAGVPVVEEALDYLMKKEGKKWGVVKPRLFRPWSAEHFLAAVPKTCKKLAVLDKTKENGSIGEPLYLDVVASYSNVPNAPYIVGGRYGVGGKEFTPGCVRAVFNNLEQPTPKNHFTVNIIDDLTHTNIPMAPEFPTIPEGTRQCMFWGLGADGTVGANHEAIKIIGDNTDMYVQGYFYYDAHKSGGLTVSHLRFGKTPIKSEYLILDADYSACHFPSYVRSYDMVALVKEGGTFALNCPWSNEELDANLPAKMKRALATKKIKLYAIDASTLADSVGLGRRVNTVMQAVFFKLSGVLPVDQAIALLKAAVTKTYQLKGSKVIDMNMNAIDTAMQQVREVPVPAAWAEAVDAACVCDESVPKPPAFVADVVRRSFRLEGDKLPVSAFEPGGVNPLSLTRHEKRGMASQLPSWTASKCMQCNECSLFCPHAAIRPFVLTPEEAQGMDTCDGKGKLAPNKFRIQVSVLDCTGCGVCAQACRFGSLAMAPATPEKMKVEAANWRRVEPRAGVHPRGAGLLPRQTVTGSQYYQPLLEFSGCCEGCGETPYVKAATQMFGERMVITNAAGCSSVWGGTWGMVPYCTNADGHGPAWGNSLFEDNAEYGFGMARSHLQRRSYLRDQIAAVVADAASGISDELRKLFTQWLAMYDKYEDPQAIVPAILKLIDEDRKRDPALHAKLTEVKNNADQLPKISYWIVGGDGWAYDIDYGGLDHVVAMGAPNVRVVVLDTEIYSNTGGQRSKATNIGAIAKFAAGGNRKLKKDLGMMFISYGDVYVASVSIHANPAQCMRALAEAESFPGTAVLLCYAPCKEHGFPMDHIVEEAKAAVDSGYWPLYRYDPRKTPALQLDSKEAKMTIKDFVMRENRYAALARQDSAVADKLFAALAENKAASYQRLKTMSEQSHAKATAGLAAAETKK